MATLPGINPSSVISAPNIKKPRRQLIWMVGFLIVASIIAVFLFIPASTAFMANPGLNGVIFFVLLLGIIYIFRQVLMLSSEVNWAETLRRSDPGISVQRAPTLLAPLATILGERSGPIRLTAITMNTVLDSISTRLDEGRDISRYMINVLVFLGLLGTFWGLLGTVSSVGDAISTLNVGGGDFTKVFDELKIGLEKPLSGMGVAFSSSLFGLSGSLILGFLDIQSSQAQNRFYMDVEEWLTSVTRFSTSGSGAVAEGDQSVPAYVQALLEQTADSLDNLQRTLARNEERKGAGDFVMNQLNERLASLTDQMKSEQDLMVKLVEGQLELKPYLQRMASQQTQGGLDEVSRGHLRNLDVHLVRMLEESASGRDQLVQEIRSDIKLLTRTIAAIAQEDRRS
jgi:hypothetical protein